MQAVGRRWTRGQRPFIGIFIKIKKSTDQDLQRVASTVYGDIGKLRDGLEQATELLAADGVSNMATRHGGVNALVMASQISAAVGDCLVAIQALLTPMTKSSYSWAELAQTLGAKIEADFGHVRDQLAAALGSQAEAIRRSAGP